MSGPIHHIRLKIIRSDIVQGNHVFKKVISSSERAVQFKTRVEITHFSDLSDPLCLSYISTSELGSGSNKNVLHSTQSDL